MTASSPQPIEAWRVVAHATSSRHAEKRGENLLTVMQDYAEQSSDNRPILSPLGEVKCEIIGLLAILQVYIVNQKEESMTRGRVEAAVFFAGVEKQLALTATSAREIDLY